MQMALTAVFSLELTLPLVHEMDAVRRHEWKLFILLKDMEDEKAYRLFMLLHIPLCAATLALLFSPQFLIGSYIVDIFLIVHALIHVGFRRHPANELNGRLSQAIIYSAGVLAVIHFAISIFG